MRLNERLKASKKNEFYCSFIFLTYLLDIGFMTRADSSTHFAVGETGERARSGR